MEELESEGQAEGARRSAEGKGDDRPSFAHQPEIVESPKAHEVSGSGSGAGAGIQVRPSSEESGGVGVPGSNQIVRDETTMDLNAPAVGGSETKAAAMPAKEKIGNVTEEASNAVKAEGLMDKSDDPTRSA